ncbi:MAG: O-methyltransferase, partial [Bacteroidota bacterium]
DFIDPALKAYCEQFTSSEPAVLQEISLETHRKVLYPRMLSGHLQGRMLATLSRMHKPRRILEVGTYTGYSAICMAEGLQAGGVLTTIEINPEREDMIRAYFEKAGVADKMDLRIGEAAKILDTLEGPFDMVFLDADKFNYIRYYEMILPKMPSGAVIMADNMLWSGRVVDENIQDKETLGLRSFVRHVAADDKTEQVLLPVRDGIMLIIRK